MEATVLALKILMEKLFHIFLEGGYLLRFLNIDDGWQETVNELHKEGEPIFDINVLKISGRYKSHLSVGSSTCIINLTSASQRRKDQALVLLIECFSIPTRAYSSLTIYLIGHFRYPRNSKEEVSLGVVLVVEEPLLDAATCGLKSNFETWHQLSYKFYCQILF
ncbi:hypothetical protein L1049_028029 [Liquidambar formosana]|uniref:Uncharacterized protein n=1 Tax=Liquidambar formosana TaxID=63359 RepID=A0AAP0RJH5_LIQFO